MKYIFIIAAFHAIFFVVLLLHKRPKELHDKTLTFWLVYLGLFTATYAFTSENLFLQHHLLSGILISLFMLHGPFLYVYLSVLASKKRRLKKQDYLHFVPFVLFVIYLLVSFGFPEYSERIRMDHVSHSIHPPILFTVFLILTALSGPLYFTLSARMFKKLDINIFNNFSYSEDVDLDWLRKLVMIFGVIWSALIVIAVIHHVFHLFSMIFCTDGLFLSLSIFIILVGYFGLRQKAIFVSYKTKDQDFVTKPKINISGLHLSETDKDRYTKKINQYMEANKPYLNPNLSLPQLADELNIPSHHLSKVINDSFGMNFFEFINQYRIDEVKKKMTEPETDNLSLLGIAYECGFNSKSAFNRVFKKITNMTPSEFKKTTTRT
ncbi:MAG: helix-turn-helix domain-containing protein [Bacteroidota bacterium]